MTSFALIVWSYQQQGSALTTSLLSVCSYAPYVAMSLFAGALCDRLDKKRTMLVCDTLAAVTTLCVYGLLRAGRLAVWHLYLLSALNGLMNTVQQPASDVTVTLLAPRDKLQRVSGLQSFSNALVTVLTPAAASAVLAFGVPCLFLAGVESPALYYTGQPRQTVHISYSCLLKFPTILIPEAVPAS